MNKVSKCHTLNTSKTIAQGILFLTSFSVILITLGIIQTLLFESINFFSELAETRGWFTFDWDFAGITSGTGIAAAIFLLVYIAELLITKFTIEQETKFDLYYFQNNLLFTSLLSYLLYSFSC